MAKRKKLNKALSVIFFILGIAVLTGTNYYINNYSLDDLEAVISTFAHKQAGVNFEVYLKGAKIVLFSLLFQLLIWVPLFYEGKSSLKIIIKDKEFRLLPLFKKKSIKLIASIILFIGSLFYADNKLKIIDYIKTSKQTTTIYLDEFIDPRDVKITFPEKKRNLIHIVIESMETSTFSSKNGGDYETSVTPELERIALNNTNFSSTNIVGGFLSNQGATYTAGSLVAQETGINIKPYLSNSTAFGSHLKGLYTLGDILHDAGYNNAIVMGSDADFANRRDYYSSHNYKIYDYLYAKEINFIPSDYRVWWGFEDEKLYELAKDEIYKLNEDDKPFNITILTADTHFLDGYTDSTCPNTKSSLYLNSYQCASIKIDKFLNWARKQDFYKDTTIVITGDHLTMQKGVFDEENRYVYNAFINSPLKTTNNRNRVITTTDMFPTILASMGVEIEGNRLGFGTNLYSNEKTISERMGLSNFNTELSKHSLEYYKLIFE